MSRYQPIRTQTQVAELMAQPTDTPIERMAFHNVSLPDEALHHTFRGCIFLACKMPHGLKQRFTDSLVFPDMGELFRFRSSLYTAESLYDAYQIGQPETMALTYDAKVYRHYLRRGKRATDIKETLARTLHDHSISTALHEMLSAWDARMIVGVMGGHALRRDEEQYRTVAHISKLLTEAGRLMISGGGPGAMEATHLGAWMAGRTAEELEDATAHLAQAPTFSDPAWLDKALELRQRYPQARYHSIGIPTWLYGHEPATPLATHIAKYFDNSIREDAVVTIAQGGLIFTPGSAGTLQEIFQNAVQNHYLMHGQSSPMVFLGADYWTKEVPVYTLLQDMLRRGRYHNLRLSLCDTPHEAVNAVVR